VEAELFHTDRRTDRHDETNSRFPQFWERAEKVALNKQNKTKATNIVTLKNDTINKLFEE
jgi:hypothetical protein